MEWLAWFLSIFGWFRVLHGQEPRTENQVDYMFYLVLVTCAATAYLLQRYLP